MRLEKDTFFSEIPTIVAMEDGVYEHDFWTKWHTSTVNELIFLMNGLLKITYNNHCNVVAPGEIGLLPADCLHREEFSDKINLETFFIHFNWKHQKEFFSVVNSINLKKLSPGTRFEVHTIINSLRSITNLNGNNRLLAQARLNLLLTIIYCDIRTISGSIEQQEFAKRQQLVKRAKSYMNANFSKNISLDDIAEYLKVSKFYVSRIFKAETNMSLFEYLNDYRMRVALQLLREGRLYISEIAESTGFSNRKYFSNVFKKFYGKPPTKFVAKKNSTNNPN
jgi:AraC-like DNA-binding protein